MRFILNKAIFKKALIFLDIKRKSFPINFHHFAIIHKIVLRYSLKNIIGNKTYYYPYILTNVKKFFKI